MTLCDDCCRSCKNPDFVAKCDTFLSQYAWRDHMALLSWINYSAHKCSVGHSNVNFDNRPVIILPSGRRIKLIITVEEVKDEPVSEVPEQ